MSRIFRVTVKKKIETTVVIQAINEDHAKALAWSHLPEEVDDWNCDIHNGTTYKVEEFQP